MLFYRTAHHKWTLVSSMCLLTTFCLLTAGCQKSNLDKVVVEGAVTFDGIPVENGEIRFYPAEGTLGPVSGAPIVDGQFVAKAKGGVPVGTHQVQIRGFRPVSKSSVGKPNESLIPGESSVLRSNTSHPNTTATRNS